MQLWASDRTEAEQEAVLGTITCGERSMTPHIEDVSQGDKGSKENRLICREKSIGTWQEISKSFISYFPGIP